MTYPRYAVLFLLTSLASFYSHAHDFWIEASSYDPLPADEVALIWRVGVGFKGDSLPYITEWIDDFSIVTSTGRRPVQSIPGSDPVATLESSAATRLIGYQGQRSFVELEPKKFNDYLRDEGMEFILKQRRDRGEADRAAPEYFVRCAKALIKGDDADDSVFGEELGYTLELIPQSDPYGLQPGGEMEFRLLYLGEPIEGLLVQAVSRKNPDVRTASRTDADGRATLRFADPSLYLVKAVHMVPLENDATARWESFWASFTFELASRP